MDAGMILYIIFIVLVVSSAILVIISFKRDNKRPMGEITVNFEKGHYVWSFSFYDDKAYEAIENMDQVTFKVKKGETKQVRTKK